MSRGLQPAEVPNSTQVPNVLFTQLLPELSSAELRAYMYICYHTFGYGKTADAISYEQFLRGQVTGDGRILDRGCGIKNRTALSQALQTLQEKGLIVAQHEHDGQGHRRASTFALVLSADDAPLAQAAGAPEYRNQYSGQSIKSGTQDAIQSIKSGTQAPQSTETSTLARVSNPVLTVPSSNRVGSNSYVARTKQTASTGKGLASDSTTPDHQSARAEDSSNKQHARARDGQSGVMSREQRVPTPLHQDERALDPEEPWLDAMVDVIHRRTGVYASREALREWKAVLWEHLEGRTEGERDDFMAYIFDDPERYLEERRNSNEVRDTLQQDGAKWNARNRPRTKKRTPLQGKGARAIPSAADIAAQEDRGESCPECRKIPGARHDYDCPSGFAGQVVGRERKTS